jgi:hypothetical protein
MRFVLFAVTALLMFLYWFLLHYLVDNGLVAIIPALICLTFVLGWFLQTPEEKRASKSFVSNLLKARL